MKKIKHLMIWIGLLLSLVSCKDTMEAIGLGGDEIPAEGVVLNIELPNFSEKKINTRAGADESIRNVTAVFYGEGNTYKDKADVKIGSKNADGTYQATISKVPSGTKTVHLVTNVSNLEETEAKNLQDIASATPRTIDTSSPVCWGCVSLTELLDGSANVSLYRQYAKVTLKVADAVKAVKAVFPEEDAGLIINHTAAKSAIAPAGYNVLTEDLAATKEFSNTNVGNGTSREVAVTETSAGEANVIIKAKYKGIEGYYKVGLYKDAKTKKDQYALLRNHNYTITVTKVNDYGFEKLDDAVNSDPENRLEADVVDDNPTITNMIACKDYELGVSDNLSLKATDTKARITLVTTLESAKYDVNFKKDSWIKGYIQVGEGIKTPVSGSLSKPDGQKYILEFTLDPNTHETPRIPETVTISSGDLKLDVKITQAGYDFMRDDPNRKVIMYNNDSKYQEDYFNWLDTEVKGIKPEQMQGVLRNNGLHFTVGKNAYSYKIPKQDEDVLTDNDSHFNVREEVDGNKKFWKVTLAENHDNSYDLWKGTFTIKNKDGINITYTVYHTGIFHKITDDMANKYELAEGGEDSLKVKGMFYYGVVKVQGQTKTYIMLDRNLGATDNSPYVPDVNELKDHKGAIGGYFKISEYDKKDKDNNIKPWNLSSTLSPEGFEIPEKSVFEDLIAKGTLKTEVRHTALGESYYCTYMNTTNSELKTIYLPYGGYLEGESHKYPMHVVFWTKTLVSGTQGFSGKSPEYGYWYNYFDIYNSKKGISNVRFVSGSNGKNTGRYKAMPLRLVRVLQ